MWHPAGWRRLLEADEWRNVSRTVFSAGRPDETYEKWLPACIDGTMIRVLNIVYLHREAKSPASTEMLEVYPSLNLAQVYSALSYYYENPEEIEAFIAEDEKWDERHEREKGEYLSWKSLL